MKPWLFLSLLLSAELSAVPGELNQWNYHSKRDLMGDRLYLHASGSGRCTHRISTEKTPRNQPVLQVTVDQAPQNRAPYGVQLVYICRKPLTLGRSYRLRFQYKGTHAGEIGATVAQVEAPFRPIARSADTVLNVTNQWQSCELDFTTTFVDCRDFATPRLTLGSYPAGGTLYFGPVTLEELPEHLPLRLNPVWQLKRADRQQQVTLTDDQLVLLENGGPPKENTTFLLTNTFEAPKAGFMQLGMSADWYFEAAINGKTVYSTWVTGNRSHEFKPGDHVFNIPVRQGSNQLAVKVRAGSGGCRFVCGAVPFERNLGAKKELFVIRESARYRPVAEDRYLVKKGTALDFSELNGKKSPAGSFGRVIANSRGRLAFERKPDEAVRFMGMNFAPSYWRLRVHTWSKADIERFADACDAQGYNMIRVHYLCRYLLGYRIHDKPHRTIAEAGLPQRGEEINFHAGNLDRFDYLIKCFKERGIYLNIDLMNDLGYSMAYISGKDELFKMDLFFKPEYRRHWAAAVHFLLNHENPYTKLKWKDEPAIAFVNYFNEQDFRLGSPLEIHKLQKPFQAWLKKRYRTEEAFRRAWGTEGVFETACVREDLLRQGGTPARDTGTFLIETMQEMTRWYTGALRKASYPGMFHHWDMIMRTMEIPARALVPAIAQHTYFAHPNVVPTRNLAKKSKGTVFMGGVKNDMLVEQTSSLNSSYFRAASTARFFDRPYMITEYSHSAFNRYRHERGLYFSSYAALQGWDNLTPHADTVRLTVDPMWCFEHGTDPIARASETVSALTFLRQDVKEAPHSVGLLLKNSSMFPSHYLSSISDDYGKLGLLTRVGILYPEGTPLMGKTADFRPTLTVEPESFSPLRVNAWYVSADNTDGKIFPELLARLRRNGILDRSNQTNWPRRIYQSETGELMLDARKLTMRVVTPRLEGAILKVGESAALPHLSVSGISTAASFTAASLNKARTLHEADRILLIVATNAFNTNMTFENSTMYCCVNPGDLPVLMESVKCEITLKTSQKKIPRIYALHLDGTRFAEIPGSFAEGKLRISLDTSTLKYGTPFFEIHYSDRL